MIGMLFGILLLGLVGRQLFFIAGRSGQLRAATGGGMTASSIFVLDRPGVDDPRLPRHLASAT